MKKVGKILVAAIAAVTAVVSVAMFAACGGEPSTAEKTVKYSATSATGSSREQAGLGNIIATATGFIKLYDDGTYSLNTTSVQYADWGGVVVATFQAEQYGTYETTTVDEYGVVATLAVPTRIVLSTTLWDMALQYGGAEEGSAFTDKSPVKDSAALSEADKALFDKCMTILAGQANIFTETTSVEITFENATYTLG